MGAVDTMEVFFEKLNGGDREGAVALMDEQTEMRVHVGDSVQTLVGAYQQAGARKCHERQGDLHDDHGSAQTMLRLSGGAASPAFAQGDG